MAAYEVLLLNTAIPQIQAAQSGDTYVVPRDIAINATAIISANSATDALRITQTGAGNAILVEDSANPDSTPFVVDAAGNVGIGTTSPSSYLSGTAKLVAYANANSQNNILLRNDSNGASSSSAIVLNAAGNTWGIEIGSAAKNNNALTFQLDYGGTNSTKMTLDSSGNLGLGVTPSAWGGFGVKAFDVGTGASFAGSGSDAGMIANAYYNGSNWIYKTSSLAVRYQQIIGTGTHAWYTAPSGTANTTTITNGVSYTIITSGNQTAFGAANNNVGTSFTANASGTLSSGTVSQNISFTQAMTLDALGNLAVGTTSPLATQRGLDVSSGGLSFITGADNNASTRTNNVVKTARIGSAHYANAEEPMALVVSDSTSTDNIVYIGGSTSLLNAATTITFFTAANNTTTTGTERARITSGGYFKASDAGTYVNAAGAYHELRQTADNIGLYISSTNASLANECLYITADRNTTNNSFYAIAYFNNGAAAAKFRVADSGDVTNTNGTYGTISDAKMKTDIVDAGSQWSDIKALRFRKFKMKDDPSGLVQLGVVAQEVEQTSPGLVDEHADKDAEGNDLGTTTKSVKTSILLMKAAVALQEAMARIETLEAEVAALKGA